MEKIPLKKDEILRVSDEDFAKRIWEESWSYIRTIVDTAWEPFLILDNNLTVLAANESFYRIFQVDSRETEGKNVFELGNNQWDIPSLRKLLEDVLPKHSYFKGYEVAHDFPIIGRKVMILNARQIYNSNILDGHLPPIILLAMEDMTAVRRVSENAIAKNDLAIKNLEKNVERLEVEMKKKHK